MIENTILGGLVHKDVYCRKVLPYLSRDYFQQTEYKVVFKLIRDYVAKYNKPPTTLTLQLDLETSSLKEDIFERASQLIGKLSEQPPVDEQWLYDKTEDFCKRQAMYHAIVKSAALVEDKENYDYGATLNLVKDALGVSFDSSIGHDYLEDAVDRYDYNTRDENKLRCRLETFNRVLRGGFVEKSLTVFILPTGVGKSLIMCNFAGDFLLDGKNVLYITLEMPERQVGARIDAHLLDVPLEDLRRLDKHRFVTKIQGLKRQTLGKLVIKEYPAHTAHSGHFRHLLSELKLKKDFVPDVIMVDYLGICASANAPKGANSYERLKYTAEEIRGLGMEFNARVFSAAQVNKEGTKAGDFEITDTAESWGIPATADYMFGGVSTEDMEKMGQLRIKRLKDRHNDKNNPSSFLIGLDRSKMRLFDLDDSKEDDQEEPVFDQSKFGSMIV